MSGPDLIDRLRISRKSDLVRDLCDVLSSLCGGRRKDREQIWAVGVVTDILDGQIEERRDLGRIALIRFSVPEAAWTLPLCDWPEDLRKVVLARYYIVPGGYEIDGRETLPFNDSLFKQYASDAVNQSDAIVLSSPFSLLYPSHELRGRDLMREIDGSKDVICSHEVSGIGLALRETASALNATLMSPATKMVKSFREVLCQVGINPSKLFFATAHGLLAPGDYASVFPGLLLGSRAVAFLQGVHFISREDDFIAVDCRHDGAKAYFMFEGTPERRLSFRFGGVLTNHFGPRVSGRFVDLESVSEWLHRACNLKNRSVFLVGTPPAKVNKDWKVLDIEVVEAIGAAIASEGVFIERFFTPGHSLRSARHQVEALAAGYEAGLCQSRESSLRTDVYDFPVPFLPEGSIGIRAIIHRN